MRSLQAIAVAVVSCSAAALADPNDIQLYKLGNPIDASGNPTAGNPNFRAFTRGLGVALSSANLMPPETLGHAGFSVAAEVSIVSLATQEPGGGPCQAARAECFMFPTQKDFTTPLLLPSVHVRKGLPFSFELGSRISWVEKSRMVAVTGELKWALNEGFTYLPDVGVRASVTRLVNGRDFELTTGGVDLGVGKQFAIGGMITFTPYVGWNLLFVGASSATVDFNPGRTQQAATSSSTAQLDSKEAGPFDAVGFFANRNNRFYGGLRFIGGVMQLMAEFSYTIPDTAGGFEGPSILAINFGVGLDF